MERILYIEDEPDPVEDMPFLLKQYSLDVIAKQSIDAALGLFQKEHFDAVLLDICMPPTEGMPLPSVGFGRETGVEVARRLRKLKPNVPIIALTVIYDPDIKARMHAAGVWEIINKPAEVARIAETVLGIIRGPRRRV